MAPTQLTLGDGSSVPVWTFDQLDLLNRANLKRRALELHTIAGPELSPMLKSGLAPQMLSLWIIDLQCALAATLGQDLTPADFGVPGAEGRKEGLRFPEHMRKKPAEQIAVRQSSQETQFTHDETFLEATKSATAENGANRKMHRGTVDQFLFGNVSGSYYLGARPNTATGKASVTATSFVEPSMDAYPWKAE